MTRPERLRILYLITELNEGGAENALWEIARGVRDQGHEVRVAALYDSTGKAGQRLRQAGISVEDVGLRHLHNLGRLSKLRKRISEFRPHLIHSWLFHANITSRFVRHSDIPLICSLRVCEPRRWQIFIDRFTRSRVDQYICNSRDVADFARHCLHVPENRCRVIKNGVDTDFFAKAGRNRSNDSTMHGLTVARVTPQKGQDILLNALARLPQSLDWHWRFVGEITERRYFNQLNKLALRAGIAGRITWVEKVEREELLQYYQQASMLALPSRWEGEPNVVLEAMAAGLPVLAAPVHGIMELLDEKPNCLLQIPDNNSEAWGNAIMHAWSKRDALDRQIKAGLELVSRRTWKDAVELHLTIYHALQSGIQLPDGTA